MMKYPKIDIIKFIDNFRTKFGEFTNTFPSTKEDTFKPSTKEDAVRELFSDGFCYYFANILEQAYPGGEICMPWPIGHFIYKYDYKYYDISGEYILKDHDCECAIPFKLPYFINEDYFKWIKMDFMHTLNYDCVGSDTYHHIFNYRKLYGEDYENHSIELTKTEAIVVVFLIYSFRYGYNESIVNDCYKAATYYYKSVDYKNRFKDLVNFAKMIHESVIKI